MNCEFSSLFRNWRASGRRLVGWPSDGFGIPGSSQGRTRVGPAEEERFFGCDFRAALGGGVVVVEMQDIGSLGSCGGAGVRIPKWVRSFPSAHSVLGPFVRPVFLLRPQSVSASPAATVSSGESQRPLPLFSASASRTPLRCVPSGRHRFRPAGGRSGEAGRVCRSVPPHCPRWRRWSVDQD